jgi:hypothetical protein
MVPLIAEMSVLSGLIIKTKMTEKGCQQLLVNSHRAQENIDHAKGDNNIAREELIWLTP